MIVDAKQREQALDVRQSFIVQAPAGSGKTELLTQRTLALLATVRYPEQVVAITFTRKAASEMRQRILLALTAAHGPEPEAAHEKTTWQLANNVLKQDTEQQWQLIDNPNRLRIQTIDAFATSLAKQMPLLSQLGSQALVQENCADLYQQAARNLLAELDDAKADTDAIENLLLHLDNSHYRVERLLIQMLQNREQWLPFISHVDDTHSLKQSLEKSLQVVIEESLQLARESCPSSHDTLLCQLADFASARVEAYNPIQACENLVSLPAAKLEVLPQWLGLSELLLTKTGSLRKQINKRQGFPVASKEMAPAEKDLVKAMKQNMQALLAELNEHPAFIASLAQCQQLPAARYPEQQWQIIESLVELLPKLVAELFLLFRQHNQIDFNTIAHAALQALGSDEQPTDLTLALDYHIQHLLIDEFQDTSVLQFRLLQRLTQLWSTGDGKTLFLVGDPMQSIYRFRQAEVGLFLKVQQLGINQIKPIPLTLQCNFRSQAKLIEWFNQAFNVLMPPVSAITTGAVDFHPSTATQAELEGNAVQCHACESDIEEAEAVAQLIKKIRLERPEEKIAILVKARSHLDMLLLALRHHQLTYQAVDIDALNQSTMIKDLWSLTRALLHLGDRLAWLSILRAPWLGLTLADLLVLSANAEQQTLWERLCDPNVQAQLSTVGQSRLFQLIPILQAHLARRRHWPLATIVESCWQAVGGPACVDDEKALGEASRFFALLRQQSLPLDYAAFEQRLSLLFADCDQQADDRLQVMTVHKSKGLEFDTVIVPGLNRSAARSDTPLLRWLQRQRVSQGSDLILAPIKRSGDDYDPIYRYLATQDKQQQFYEETRLLYVAATRAKKHLHWFTAIKVEPETDEIKLPGKNSLLYQLWPVIREPLQASFHNKKSDQLPSWVENTEQTAAAYRLKNGWKNPYLPACLHEVLATESITVHPPSKQRITGLLVHKLLELVGKQLTLPETARWKTYLKQQGGGEISGTIVAEVEQCIQKVLADPRGQWLFSKNHSSRACEFAVTGELDNKPINVVIDYTFVDQEGVRWIIDYKTANQTQTAHKKQLQCYAQLMQQFDPQHPIKLGLYFPMTQQWVEVTNISTTVVG